MQDWVWKQNTTTKSIRSREAGKSALFRRHGRLIGEKNDSLSPQFLVIKEFYLTEKLIFGQKMCTTLYSFKQNVVPCGHTKSHRGTHVPPPSICRGLRGPKA